MSGVGDHEEMRVLFRGREYRLTFNCDREARSLSECCDVRAGEDWLPVGAYAVGENEIVFSRAFGAMLVDALRHEVPR